MEYLDDVAIHLSNGKLILEQTKSALKQNPLSDWSTDLWKAISNWIELVANPKFDIKNAAFQIYVTPKKALKLAEDIDKAVTPADVAKIKDGIEKKLKKSDKPPACIEHLQRFLDTSDDIRFEVISRIKIISIDDDPLEPIRNLLEPTIPNAAVDSICQAVIGMAKEQADRFIRNSKPAILDADDFKKAFKAFIQKNNLPNLLVSFSQVPPTSKVEGFLSARTIFIQQLELIDASSDQCIRAVSDYLRSSADKTAWAEAGIIVEQSINDWDEHLVRQHQFISNEIADTNADKASKVRGRLAYNRCSQINPPLDGRAVPGHFVHGCYNALADEMRLGWHPDYQELLDGEDK